MNFKFFKSLLYIIGVLGISTFQLYAQKESNNWYFGTNAGITFNTDPPTALTDGALTASEGCASISDANGNLLFYSNGLSVWNRNHTIMPNGNGLGGQGLSTQSSLIVKQPGSSNLYYIFTVPDQTTSGRYTYSIVDMTLDGGLGNVTSVKNYNLLTNFSVSTSVFNATEALTAVYHANQEDVWVVVHEYNTSRFYSYLLTSSGLQNPIASVSGLLKTNLGQCRFSPDATKLALGGYYGNGAELYSFDSSTGIISNAIAVVANGTRIYGVSFSPDSKSLYVTDNSARILQFDIRPTTETAIRATQYVVGTGSGGSYPQLQLGPDGKIYLAQSGRSYLGIINNPNVLGSACNFVDNGISLSGKSSRLGLPTFMVNYVTISPPIVRLGNDTLLCAQQTIELDAKNPGATYVWNTGARTQKILVSTPGTYYVDVTNSAGTVRDEIIVQYVSFSVLNIPLDYTYCSTTQSNVELNPTFSETVFKWNDNSTTLPYILTTPGAYWLERSIGQCVQRDNITVVEDCPVLLPVVQLGNDTLLCAQQTIELDAKNPGATYVWNTGARTQKILVSTPGTYYVDVTNSAGTVRDEIIVQYVSFSVLNIPLNYTYCSTTQPSVELNPTFSETVFKWNDNSTTLPYIITTPGAYWLERSIGQCVQRDNITVVEDCPALPLVIPNLITANNDGMNDAFHVLNLPEGKWEVKIFNRWGKLVFEQIPYQNNWMGANVGDGMYFYELRKINSDEKHKGWVHLLH